MAKELIDNILNVKKIESEFERINELINGMVARIAAFEKLSISFGNAKSLKDIEGLQKAYNVEIAKTAKEYDTIIKKTKQLTDEQIKAQQVAAKETALRKSRIKEQNDGLSLLDKERARLANLTKAYQEVAIAKGRDSAEAKKLLKEQNELAKSLQQLNVDTKNYHDNVGNYPTTILSARAEMKKLTAEIIAAKIANQENTPEIIKAKQRLGELKDAMSDTAAEAKILGSDTKNLDMAVGIFRGIGSAAQFAESATQLFGAENEKVQEGIRDMMAVQTMLNASQEIGNALQKESAFMMGLVAIKTKIATAWQWAFNAAQKASIGVIGLIVAGAAALVVGIIALASAFKSNAEKVEIANNKLEEYRKTQKKTQEESEFYLSQLEKSNKDEIDMIDRKMEANLQLQKANQIEHSLYIQLQRERARNGEEIGEEEITKSKEYTARKIELEREYTALSIDLQIKLNEEKENKRKEDLQKHEEYVKKIADEKINKDNTIIESEQNVADAKEQIGATSAEILEAQVNYELELWEEAAAKEIKLAEDIAARKKQLQQDIHDAIITIGNNYYEGQIRNYDTDLNAEKESLQKKLQNEKLTENERKVLESESQTRQMQIEKQKVQIQQRQFRFNRRIALAEIIIKQGPAIMEAWKMGYAGIPLIAMIMGSALLQTGMIMSTPEPKYKKGRKGGPATFATVSEAGPELMITQDGKSFLTPEKESRIFIPQGADIIPNNELNSMALKESLRKPQYFDDYSQKFNHESIKIFEKIDSKLDKLKPLNIVVDGNGVTTIDGNNIVHYLSKKYHRRA